MRAARAVSRVRTPWQLARAGSRAVRTGRSRVPRAHPARRCLWQPLRGETDVLSKPWHFPPSLRDWRSNSLQELGLAGRRRSPRGVGVLAQSALHGGEQQSLCKHEVLCDLPDRPAIGCPACKTTVRRSRPRRPRETPSGTRAGAEWSWPVLHQSGGLQRLQSFDQKDVTASSRSSLVSRARYTSPMPPWPIRAVTSYGPSGCRGFVTYGLAGL